MKFDRIFNRKSNKAKYHEKLVKLGIFEKTSHPRDPLYNFSYEFLEFYRIQTNAKTIEAGPKYEKQEYIDGKPKYIQYELNGKPDTIHAVVQSYLKIQFPNKYKSISDKEMQHIEAMVLKMLKFNEDSVNRDETLGDMR